jgi:hypothetical protein
VLAVELDGAEEKWRSAAQNLQEEKFLQLNKASPKP